MAINPLLALLKQSGLLGSNAPLGAAMPSVGPMEPQMPQYDLGPQPQLENPYQAQMEADRNAYLAQLAQGAPVQAPSQDPVQPAYRTDDAIKIALGLLGSGLLGGKQGPGEFLQAYAGGKQQQANQKTQRNEMKRQEENQRLGQAYNTGLQVAEAKLGFSTQDFNREEGQQFKREQAADKATFEQQRRDETNLTAVSRAYSQAKTLPDMIAKAKRWRELEAKLGLDITAPDEESITKDYMQRSSGARNVIEDNWRQLVAQLHDEYGVIKGKNLTDALKTKKRYEEELRAYGTEADLYLPTEANLKKDKQDAWLTNLREKRIDDHDAVTQRIAKMKADIARAKERIAISQQNSKIAGFNADTSRMNAELRRTINESNRAVQGKVRTEQAKIDGLKAKQKKLAEQGNILGARAVESEIAAAASRRDFWKSEIEGPPEDLNKITADSGFTSQTSSGVKFSFKPGG